MPKPKQPSLLEQMRDKLPWRKKKYPCKDAGGRLYKRHRYVVGAATCTRCRTISIQRAKKFHPAAAVGAVLVRERLDG